MIEKTCPITMISPTLGGPVLEPTRQEIELDPVAPVPPEVITIQEFRTVGTHEQSPSVDTLIEPDPPAPTDAAHGLMPNLQVAGLRACATEAVEKPTVRLPVLERPPFWATAYLMYLLPLPLVPDAIRDRWRAALRGPRTVAVRGHIHRDGPTGVAQRRATRIERVTACRRIPELRDGGSRGPDRRVPVRPGPVLAATLNATEPFPLPLAPEVSEIHGALLWAVHEQSLSVDTLIEIFPPG